MLFHVPSQSKTTERTTYGMPYLRFRWSRLWWCYGRRVYRLNWLGFREPCEWEWLDEDANA